MSKIQPSGREQTFSEDEIIVSKTDLQGTITYANHVFLRVSGFTEAEVLGKPHSIIRHPDMPRCVFKLLWETIQSGKEIFAYVVNLCKNGDHYWVFAHVTPTFDEHGAIIGFHSNRRVPQAESLIHVKELYQSLRAEEERHSDRRVALQSSYAMLTHTLSEQKKEYEEFVWTL